MEKNENELQMDGTAGLAVQLCDKSVSIDVSSDVVLPDYQPEIRRLLYVDTKIMPPARYVSPSGVECNGNMEVRAVYVGMDGEIYSATATSEYEFKVALEDADRFDISDGISAVVSVVCGGNTFKVNGGRRISVRTKLLSHVRCFADQGAELSVYGDADPATVENLFLTVENADICAVTSEIIELAEEIGNISDLRVIYADADVSVGNIRNTDSGASIGGDVELKLLTCKDGAQPDVLTRKVRFDVPLDDGALSGEHICRATGKVTDLNVDVEDSRINCRMSVMLSVFGAKNDSRQYVKDTYSTERQCECEMKKLPIARLVYCQNGNFSQSERIPLDDKNLPADASVTDHSGYVYFDGCEYTDGKYALSGKSRYTVVYSKDGEYNSFDIDVPVRYVIDGEAENELSYDAVGRIRSSRIRIEGNTLCIDSEIEVSADIFSREEVETVSAVRFGEKYGAQGCRMTVCYPADNEGAWEIAKKYHVPVSALSEGKGYYIF